MAINETDVGLLSGAAAGFSVGGPIGMAVGGIIGALSGRSAKRRRRREERRILVANTKQAYTIGAQHVETDRNNRAQVSDNYTRDVGKARALFAAGGAKTEGRSWDAVMGSIAANRAEVLESLDTDMAAYKKSTAYEFIKKDFESMRGKTGKSASDVGTLGTSFYTKEQSSVLRDTSYHVGQTATKGSDATRTDYAQKALHDAYITSITPSFGEYETSRFGSVEDKVAFETMMTDRITEANTVYDRDLAVNQFVRRQNTNLHGERANR